MPTLEDLASGLRVKDTYAMPMARGDVPTGPAPYMMPTDILSVTPAPASTATSRAKPKGKKSSEDESRLNRILGAVIYSPTPIVDFRDAPPTVIPIAKTGLQVGRDASGQYPLAIDLQRIQLGDIEWLRQKQRGG